MKRIVILAAALVMLLGWSLPASAETSAENAVTAAPPVSRPTTASCTITLMNNQQFGPTTSYSGTYTPTCGSGPWSKVVLDWNGYVPAGRQYDRLAGLWVGGAEIFHTITPEPSATSGVSWHVDKDVSEYIPMLTQTEPVVSILENYITSVYTSPIYITATLTFYSTGAGYPAASHPDSIVPIDRSPGYPWFLSPLSAYSPASATLTLPTNLTRAYLEVYATGHNCDEFWYGNPPDDYANANGFCGGGAFREIQVLIDGRLAGVAWPFENIYTGGVNPYLWRPIPAVDAFNVKPYVVNVTPFVGLLTDGQPHTITIQIANAQSYWKVDANLLLYQDPNGSTSGAVTGSPAPAEATVSTGENANNRSATFSTTAGRDVTFSGWVKAADGTVTTTTVHQVGSFSNSQVWNLTNYLENLKQSEDMTTATTTQTGGNTTVETVADSFPLAMTSAYQIPDQQTGDKFILPATIDQTFNRTTSTAVNGSSTFSSALSDNVHAEAILVRSTTTGQNEVANGHTTERYVYSDSTGACYNHFLGAAQGAVTTDQLSSNCH